MLPPATPTKHTLTLKIIQPHLHKYIHQRRTSSSTHVCSCVHYIVLQAECKVHLQKDRCREANTLLDLRNYYVMDLNWGEHSRSHTHTRTRCGRCLPNNTSIIILYRYALQLLVFCEMRDVV